MKKSTRLWCAALLLACLTALSPLGASGEIVELPIDFTPGMPLSETYEIGKMEYEDPSIRVERSYAPISVTYKGEGLTCNYYVVRVKIANATQLRTVAADSFKSSMKDFVVDIISGMNAVLAINGDYYSDHPGAFLLRQGVLYRNSVLPDQDVLLIDEAGDLHAILAEENPGQMDLTQVDGKKVINGFNFGPCIVRDGQRMDDSATYAKSPNNSKPWEPAQRICIGQTGELEYIIVACAFGIPLDQFADLVMSMGDVQTAYMLDGGNSVQVVFLGTKINNTSSAGRVVPDCIYFASAYQAD